MTSTFFTGDEVDQGIELDPDVPFPPFPIWLRIPATWSRLDSHPATWRASAERLMDERFQARRLAARERRDVLAVLEGVVADCQRAGAALSLLALGRRQGGGAASFGMHLAFADDGRAASLGRVLDCLPRTGVTSEISTRSGPAVAHRDRITMVVPGSAEIVALSSLQIFVPLAETSWTVVLSTASAFPELTEPLAVLLRAVAESVCVQQDGDSSGGAPDATSATRPAIGRRPAPGVRTSGWTPVAPDQAAVGFERGFGTLVQRRIDPPSVPEIRAAGPGTGAEQP